MNKIKNKKMLLLALEDDLKKELEVEAQLSGLTTSAYIRLILIKRKDLLK